MVAYAGYHLSITSKYRRNNERLSIIKHLLLLADFSVVDLAIIGVVVISGLSKASACGVIWPSC